VKDYLRKKLIHWLVKDLFNALTPDDILTFLPGGFVRYKGKKLVKEEIVEIQESAERFSNSVIWKLLRDDARYNATETMYNQSRDYGGMLFGKAMLYCLDILEKRLQQLSNLRK